MQHKCVEPETNFNINQECVTVFYDWQFLICLPRCVTHCHEHMDANRMSNSIFTSIFNSLSILYNKRNINSGVPQGLRLHKH